MRRSDEADELLSNETVWNRHDTRERPAGAKTLSFYCAMEQIRAVIQLAAPNTCEHRLMGYNNDPEVFHRCGGVGLQARDPTSRSDQANGSSPTPYSGTWTSRARLKTFVQRESQ